MNVSGSTGDNTLNGGEGNDILIATDSAGNNLLYGGDASYFGTESDRDTLNVSGSTGNNTLNGGEGNDILIATDSTGNNLLYGGNGNDSIYGGLGTDTFAYNSYNEGVDSLYNFKPTKDRIQVSITGFGGGLSIGSLQTSQFTIGASATTSVQRFIYNSATGGLYFDHDGSASGFTQVKFAQLSAGLSLSNDNFVVA
ncbi:calcium-binding protein [Nostoc sp. JL31]|uniref:calcium-binding protein n=1 Tax=Nostoc sp. JL31 TaxID=2815395 RepID=UPI0025DDD250|nr:calcium-binding protein [Nostoc sp. JL31]